MEQQDELFPGNRIEREVRVINSDDQRYELFVAAYVNNGLNATRAAVAAGYSEATAASQGSRLLKRPEIAAAIATKTRDMVENMDYSAERTLKEIKRLAFFDIRRVYRTDGSLKPVHELDDETAAAVLQLETSEMFAGRGEEREQVGVMHKVKFIDKGANLDRLMRYHSLYKDKVEHSGAVTLISHIPRPQREVVIDADRSGTLDRGQQERRLAAS